MDVPMKNGGSFHSFLYVYQRVIHIESPWKTMELLPSAQKTIALGRLGGLVDSDALPSPRRSTFWLAEA
jgi:hypothetical protein